MKTRRDFIKNSMIVGAGLLLMPTSVAQGFSSGKGKRVCIIGAGFAGLAAANKLNAKGWNVTILESRSRIGGRVFSHQLNEKHVVELGAEWVGASHNRMIDMCDSFGLKLLNNQFDSHLIYKGEYFKAGEWGYSSEWESKFKKIIENYKHMSNKDLKKLDQYDWWRYLVNNGCDGRDLDIRELLDSRDFGESIRHVSAFSALAEYAESSPKNEMDLKIEGGNGLFAEKLAEYVGRDRIFLNHIVTHIDQTKKVRVTCSNGKVFECDKVICTVPTFAMTKIKWTPELPKEKLNAINELQYARINKHVVTFTERFWKDEAFDMVTDECPHYFYHATKNQKGPEGALIAYTIGEKAAVFGNRSKAAAAIDINNTLKPYFGDISSKILAQTNFYWGNEEYSKGAYALYGNGQWFKLRPALKKSFINTHFAGEHLADWQGFMEGAIVTGEEAAEAIM